MASVASYPHVEIGVKDASIYVPRTEENLPLHRPLYMMRTQRGPVNVPVWCPSYQDAVQIFGADTFNKNSQYYSEDAYFLKLTFPMNGAFICRVADSNVANASVTLELGISKEKQAIPQWMRDVNGQFVRELDGSLIPINENGEEQQFGYVPVYSEATEELAVSGVKYYTKEGNNYVEATGITPGTALPRETFVQVGDNEAFVPGTTYYTKNEGGEYEVAQGITEFEEGVTYYKKVVTVFYKVTGEEWVALEDQATILGNKLVWRAVPMKADRVPGSFTAPSESEGFYWYPMMDIKANNPGVWGENFGVKLFFDANSNTIAAQTSTSAATFTLCPVELLSGDTVPTEVIDAYGQSSIGGVIRPGVVDKESEMDLTLEKLVPLRYSGKQELPISIKFCAEAWNAAGKELMKTEIGKRAEIYNLYKTLPTIEDGKTKTFVDDLLSTSDKIVTEGDLNNASEAGYMANPLSCVSADNLPYFTLAVVDQTDDMVKEWDDEYKGQILVPSADTPIYLAGGNDGALDDASTEKFKRSTILSVIKGTHEYLCDYWRCPCNALIDTGVSLDTKKAYLDLMAVRDDIVVNLSTQVTWKTKGTPVENDRFTDEHNGELLRAYALLMKEDIINGTGACRAKIFLHAGYRSDHDGPVASTLWIALKNAEYLNKDYIDKEPKELPNAAIECWSQLSWAAHNEDTKARCWNAGLNYAQYYSMTELHYASVRSVYTYETSVLVDAGVVDALTFCKHIIRKTWSVFAGGTRPAAITNAAVKDELQKRITYMLNKKFTATLDVYQTDEDVKLGFSRHVQLDLEAPGSNRVWKTLIVCRREGFNPEEA